MNAIVMQNGQVIDRPAGTTGERTVTGEGIVLSTRLSDGMNPSLRIHWRVPRSFWARGFRLKGFYNRQGFSPAEFPEDLARHGELIVESVHDADFDMPLTEGNHFYTFVLTGRRLFIFTKVTSPLRFSVNIGSLKTAIGRIEDHLTVAKLLGDAEIMPLVHALRMAEAQFQLNQANARINAQLNPPKSASRVESKLRDVSEQMMDDVAIRKGMRELTERLTKMRDFNDLKPHEKRKILKDLTGSCSFDEERFQV